MPDAWTILKTNSSLVSGDAWEHLNNQIGGTGTGVVLIDGLEVNLSWLDTDVLVDFMEVDVEIDLDYTVEIEYCVSE